MTQPTTEVLNEGKTKKIVRHASDPDGIVRIVSKDDITAGDGAKHDILKGKAALATRTTCNVFRLLQASGIPAAFGKQIDPVTFTAPLCEMLPYEVVVRREAHGSYLKRAPHLAKGHLFTQLVVEFFLKTNKKKWNNHDLICDDSFMTYDHATEKIHLYDPTVPNLVQNPAKPFLTLPSSEVFSQEGEEELLEQMANIAMRTFLVLEKAWQLKGRRLVDFKVEFGKTRSNVLFLADVIDNDSWRVLNDGANMDKQVYRDGGDLDVVLERYRQVAELTDGFEIPVQQILLWRGSVSDNLAPFSDSIHQLFKEQSWPFLFNECTCSIHKQPVHGYNLLQRRITDAPDTVIIAYIGRSNGAGPVLSANTTNPVITVPADYKGFPDDVWSSLRAPSDTPVMTVLEPINAVRAALQILAMRNPAIYAALRFEQERRLY